MHNASVLPPKGELIDRDLDGKLGELLATWRAEGQTWDDCAFLIRERTGRRVTGTSLVHWAVRLGVVEEASA